MSTDLLSQSLRDTLDAFGTSAEPMTTSEVAECVDVSRRSTYDRLERLADQGVLDTKKVGARGRIWWRPATQSVDDRPPGAVSAAVYDALVDAVSEYAIFVLDEEGYVQTWNPGAERIKGYEADEILGEHFSTFYTETDRQDGVPEQNLSAAADHGSTVDEGWRVRNDGSRFWATVTITEIHDDDGDRLGYAKVTRDMTERREREQRLREEKAFNESLLDTQRDFVYAFDTEGRLIRWNDRFREVTGYTDDELDERRHLDFVAEAATDRAAGAIEDVLDGESLTLELPLVTADGEQIPYEFSATPLTEDGEVVGLTGIGRDVSERKARERQLERRRDELEAELDDIFERISDGFFAVDETLCLTYVNDRAETLLGVEDSAVAGRDVRELLALTDSRESAFETAIENQVSLSLEEYYEPLDRWFDVALYPSETGVSVYVRDVTDRKKREQELVRYETLFEQSSDVNAVVAPDGTYQYLTPSASRELGYSPAELVGENGFEYIHPEDHQTAMEAFTAMLDDPDYEPTVEFRFEHADGSWVTLEARARNLLDDPNIEGIVVSTRDVTDRKERKRELERRVRQLEVVTGLGQRALEDRDVDALMTEAAGLVADTLDTDYCKVLDLDADADRLLLRQGVGWQDGLVGEATVSAVADDSQAAYTLSSAEPVVVADLTTESRFSGPDLLRSHDVRSGISVVIGSLEEPWGILGTHDTDPAEFTQQDVNFVQSVANILATAIERHDREQELHARRRQLQDRERALHRAYTVVADPDSPFDEKVEALLSVVREALGLDYGTLSNVHGEEYVFEVVDTPSDADLGPGDTTELDSTNCKRVLETGQTLALQNVETDAPELADPPGNADWDISSYLGTPVVVDDETYGTFCFYDMEARPEPFSDWEVAFVELLGNWLGNELERQRHTDQLAALNNLNEVAREITDAVLDQSTRAEIEQSVCERLASTDSYLFAWTGTLDPVTQTVELQTEAGVDGYLDDITISVDPDDDRSEGPTGRALRTGEIQTSRDVRTDSQYDPWREHSAEYGFRSSAAIPIVHEETVYGVLNVYAERPRAFEGDEGLILAQLGEVVGHAIAAVERKRALMSDDVVELEFHIPDVFSMLGLDADSDGRITIDAAVPLHDDEYTIYGTATAEATENLSALVEDVSHWKDVTIHDQDGDTRFQLRVSEPPVLSVLASLGGAIEEATVENGDYHMTLQMAPTADTRQLIDAVQDTYPTAKMVARRQVSRPDTAEQLGGVITEELTDRQRATLRAAYHAGFFEWPRRNSGEEVAESLDVSQPTFHQHLRKSQQKIFDSLLSTAL